MVEAKETEKQIQSSTPAKTAEKKTSVAKSSGTKTSKEVKTPKEKKVVAPVTRRYGLTDKDARAFCKNIRTSPRKLNLVAEMIRGIKAEKAIHLLTFNKKRVANEVKATLMSAIANAENNHGLDIDKLIVKEAYVGKSIVMKRFRAEPEAAGQKF